MKEVGVFICNYNKAHWVVKCVQAFMEQTFQDLDVLVVDNASTDDSVNRLREAYGERITILQNSENIGGSGGFGRAVQTAVGMGYPYFMLVDNDAIADRRVVEHLHGYMEAHKKTGICGAETRYMQQPDRIQDLGGKLNYKSYNMSGILGRTPELGGNVIMECEYVASCMVMARTEAVRQFGGFPEENFIYWDDVEWCTKCRNAGYKVVVNGYAKAYHDFSDRNIQNMFVKYYMERNRWKYFTRYLSEGELETFYQTVTRDFFQQNYGAMHKGKYGTVLTAWNALDDFMHGITGKAEEGKIVPYDAGKDRLSDRVKASTSVLIYMPKHEEEDYHCLNRVLRYLMKYNCDIRIVVTFTLDDYGLSDYDMVLHLCRHLTTVKENILPAIYVDAWCNYILDEKDYWYFSHFEEALAGFQKMYWPLYETQKKNLRKEITCQ